MEIYWLKNSTFLIKTLLGKRILIDPFNLFNTFNNIYNPDIICFSKDLDNSNSADTIDKSIKVISNNEDFSSYDIKIKSYCSYSDNLYGLKRGKNYIHVFEIDGYKLCHLGYLGEIPNNEMINIFTDMDFLFLPIGGNVCIDGSDAYRLCKLLNPNYIIPMCYKCSNDDFYYSNAKDFFTYNDNKTIVSKENILDTTSLSLMSKCTVIIFNMLSFKNCY